MMGNLLKKDKLSYIKLYYNNYNNPVTTPQVFEEEDLEKIHNFIQKTINILSELLISVDKLNKNKKPITALCNSCIRKTLEFADFVTSNSGSATNADYEKEIKELLHSKENDILRYTNIYKNNDKLVDFIKRVGLHGSVGAGALAQQQQEDTSKVSFSDYQIPYEYEAKLLLKPDSDKKQYNVYEAAGEAVNKKIKAIIKNKVFLGRLKLQLQGLDFDKYFNSTQLSGVETSAELDEDNKQAKLKLLLKLFNIPDLRKTDLVSGSPNSYGQLAPYFVEDNKNKIFEKCKMITIGGKKDWKDTLLASTNICNYFKEEGDKMYTWNSIIFQNLNALYSYKEDIKILFPSETDLLGYENIISIISLNNNIPVPLNEQQRRIRSGITASNVGRSARWLGNKIREI